MRNSSAVSVRSPRTRGSAKPKKDKRAKLFCPPARRRAKLAQPSSLFGSLKLDQVGTGVQVTHTGEVVSPSEGDPTRSLLQVAVCELGEESEIGLSRAVHEQEARCQGMPLPNHSVSW